MPSSAEARFSVDESVALVDGTPSSAARFSIDEEVTDILGSTAQYVYENVGFVVVPGMDGAQYVYENVGFVVIPSHDGTQYVYEDVISGTGIVLNCVPMPYSMHVYLNGVEQQEDIDWVYNLSANKIIILNAMGAVSGDLLEALYACENT